jgi:4-hydroxy-3-methylbut-2-en-1-yl diphosphate reductase
MKINLAKSAGFCFGVKRALKVALETAKQNKKVYMLGDIVHNEDVVNQIEKAGIKKTRRLSCGKGKVLLIRAHGTSENIEAKAHNLGYTIVDATCPMVKEIHKIARGMEQKGHSIIIIGDKKHNEVQGIVGQLKRKALVIDNTQSIPLGKIKKIKKACVVVQSTQNIDKVTEIIKAITPCLKDLKFFNTICIPTRIKQEEIRKMPRDNDVMLVIGSKTSANTKRLYEISKSLNNKTYWIASKKEIKTGWLKDAKKVGVTAGASTPDQTTQDIISYLRNLN